MKSWVQSHLNVGLIVGVLLVLLTYLVVTQQAANSGAGNRVVTTVAQWLADKQLNEGPRERVATMEAQQIVDKELIQAASETEKQKQATKVLCSTDERLSDYCELEGDIRIRGRSWSVDIVPSTWSERHEWKIRPYSRRTATHVDLLNVTQLPGPATTAAPACTVTYTRPAIIFALGGYSGNVFHDHADVLLPLFYLTRQYGGEVQLLVINRVQPWWLGKYALALRAMSRYDVVNLDGDAHVRCFRRVTAGLRLHKDFGIVPEQVPGGLRLAMPDFTAFLRDAYALPRGATTMSLDPSKKPRMMLIQRQPHRRFVNEKEIVAAAEEKGFEVVVTELKIDAAVDEQARLVNSFDAIVGLHGAGMTNEVFLPPGGVLVQVVPWGNLDLMARVEYGEPAAEMGLKYLCYNITAQESSLLEEFGPDDPVITDPDSVHRRGWAALYDIYLTRQDVHLDIARFSLTLAEAMEHLRRQQKQQGATR